MTSIKGTTPLIKTIATRDEWTKLYSTRLFQLPLEFESPAAARAHWLTFLSATRDAVVLVRAGEIESDIAFRQLHDWAERYFDTEDDQSRFSIQCVLKAFKSAFANREK